jgi:hypothetical protein
MVVKEKPRTTVHAVRDRSRLRRAAFAENEKDRHLCIFPADVQSERSVVERLIESIALEHDVHVAISYANRLRKPKLLSQYAVAPAHGHQLDASLLCPCFWEYQDTDEEHEYHEQVPNTGQYDLVVCILWSCD